MLLHHTPNYFGNSRRLYILGNLALSIHLFSFSAIVFMVQSLMYTRCNSEQEKSICNIKKCPQKIKVSIFQFSLSQGFSFPFSFLREWSERKQHYKVLQNPCGNGFQIRAHITDRREETAQTSVFLCVLFPVYSVSPSPTQPVLHRSLLVKRQITQVLF